MNDLSEMSVTAAFARQSIDDAIERFVKGDYCGTQQAIMNLKTLTRQMADCNDGAAEDQQRRDAGLV